METVGEIDSARKSKKKNNRPTVLEVSKIVNQLSSSVACLQEQSGATPGRIERVESKMDNLESKMDFLINVVTKDKEASAPVSQSTAQASNFSDSCSNPVINSHPLRYDNDCVVVQDGLTRGEVLPLPAQLQKEENHGGILDAMFDREEYQVAGRYMVCL